MPSRSLDDLDPDVAAKARALIAEAAKHDIVLGVTQTYRTFEEQERIYEQGRSLPGKVVTFAKPGYSWHNWRRAFDVDIISFPGDPKVQDYYNGPWEQVGELGEALGLHWGGRWGHPDRDHFELPPPGATLAAMLSDHPQGLA